MTRPTSDCSFCVYTVAVATAFLLLCAVATARQAAGAEPAQKSAPTSVWKGVYTEKQALRGKKAYEDDCASCHPVGEAGDEAAPSLVGEAFTTRWTEQTVGDVYVATRETMPQSAPASLSKEVYADMVAYMLQINKYPAGHTELPSNLEALQLIVIDENPAK